MGAQEMFKAVRRASRNPAAYLLIVLACTAACASPISKNGSGMTNDEKNGPFVYVALGDSTGVGLGAKNGGYVAHLFARIKGMRPDSRLVNLCESGAETSDVLRRQLQEALDARPSLVTLGIGINDVSHGETVENFEKNYMEIITRLKAETNARIVITNIPDISVAPAMPAYLRSEIQSRVKLFNERIREIAQRHGLPLVDVYTTTHEILGSHRDFFSSDGFHPSDVGYQVWADAMWPAVKTEIER